MPAIVAAGANIVGGCCGTTPAYIAALVAALRVYRGRSRATKPIVRPGAGPI